MGDNVRKAAGWLFPNSQAGEKARERRGRETADYAPAYGTRSRKTAKKANTAANPLADLWNSATGATNQEPGAAGSDGVADFLSKIVGGAAGGGDVVEQLKGALGGANVQDVLGALAGAVNGQNPNGDRR